MKLKFFAALAGTALALTVQAQRVPTLEETVYGRLIKTELGGAVRWMPDAPPAPHDGRLLAPQPPRRHKMKRLWGVISD